MKKIFSGMLVAVALLVVLTAGCAAQEMTKADITQWLKPALGEWYTLNGRLAIVVKDMSINDCPITGSPGLAMLYPQTGTLRINEAGQTRLLQLDVFGDGIHQYMIVDGTQVLRRTKHAEHFESLGGAYLGMTTAELVKAYGQPDRQVAAKDQLRWEYTGKGVAAIVKNDIVIGLRLYKNSNCKFDKSGLGAQAVPADYAKAYGLAAVPAEPKPQDKFSHHFSIGHNEYIFLTTEFVQLTVYDSWLFN